MQFTKIIRFFGGGTKLFCVFALASNRSYTTNNPVKLVNFIAREINFSEATNGKYQTSDPFHQQSKLADPEMIISLIIGT